MRDRGKSVISKWRTETYRRSRLHGPSIETNSADTLISDFWSLELWESQCLMFYPLESFGLQRRSNQSILKEISPEYLLEGQMLKLKLQYLATWCEELTHWERPWCWERLEAGGEGDDRGWDGWMVSPREFELALGVGDGQGSLVCYSPWGHKESDTTERLNWTECVLPISSVVLCYSTLRKWMQAPSLKRRGLEASVGFMWPESGVYTPISFLCGVF